jgi:dTDP-4-dehydrorhamnose reductase
MKVLVVGQHGFVGRRVSEHVRRAGHEVRVLGSRYSCNLTIYQTADAAILEHKPDLVINCAGNKNIKECAAKVDSALASNVVLPTNLAIACAKYDSKLAHISTDHVFSGNLLLDSGRYRYNESDIPNPCSIYGRTKLAAEYCVLNVMPHAWVIRTGGLFDKTSPLFDWLLPQFEDDLIVSGYINVTNTPTYIGHLTAMILMVAEQRLDGGIYHVSGGVPMSRYEWFCLIAKSYGYSESLIEPMTVENDESFLNNVSLVSNRIYSACTPEIGMGQVLQDR